MTMAQKYASTRLCDKMTYACSFFDDNIKFCPKTLSNRFHFPIRDEP